jgi:glycosyltransferase involved in cell wall biosynthesis
MINAAPTEGPPGDAERETIRHLELLPSEPFVLFVGALRRVKGVAELLAAYERLSNPPPLVLIGTLEPDSPSVFPAGVHVLQDFPHEAVMAAWDRSMFGVFPSHFPEPLGTVVCEAMSRGKPAIGTAPGGHTDMIRDGETGLIVPRGDVPALTAAMRLLIDDQDMRTRLGEAARERATHFTAAVSIPRIEQLYDTLLYDRSSRG